jgi:hypothetical protein
MQDSKMKDISICDVKDKRSLSLFREKIERWKSWLSDSEDCHSIANQLYRLFENSVVFRTFIEAIRLSERRNDPATGCPWTIIGLLDENFMDSQATAIRRLTDKGTKSSSLRNLFTQITKNVHLYTRENYVCYDGTSYCDEDPIDDSELNCQEHQAKWERSKRHQRYDVLSATNENTRSRKDRISPTVFRKITGEIERDFKVTEEVKTYVDKWVAHAEATRTLRKHDQVRHKISLHKFDKCYQALIRIGKKIELLTDDFLQYTVPAPQLENWDKPLVMEKDLKALYKYWAQRVQQIEDWDKRAIVVST